MFTPPGSDEGKIIKRFLPLIEDASRNIEDRERKNKS